MKWQTRRIQYDVIQFLRRRMSAPGCWVRPPTYTHLKHIIKQSKCMLWVVDDDTESSNKIVPDIFDFYLYSCERFVSLS